MPLLVHAVLRPLGVHGQAVEHARLADGEVGDVDHLLHFAVALGLDLAVLERDQRAERVLGGAQRVAEQADGFAAPRRGHIAPRGGGFDGAAHDGFVVGDGGAAHLREHFAGRRIDRSDQRCRRCPWTSPALPHPGAGVDRIDAESLEDAGDVDA